MKKEKLNPAKKEQQDIAIAIVVVVLFIGLYSFLTKGKTGVNTIVNDSKITINKTDKTVETDAKIDKETVVVSPLSPQSVVENNNKKTPPSEVNNTKNITKTRPTLLTLGNIKLKKSLKKELTTNLNGLSQLIHFQSGTDVIWPKSKPAVDAIADLLKKHPKIDIEIQSHTNNTQPEEELERVTNLRALKIKKELQARGVTNSLIAKGYGSKQPLVSNKTNQGRYINRRIEFVIK